MSVIKQIREAIETRVEATTSFKKLQNKFNLEKNSNINSTTRYGVIAKDGVESTPDTRVVSTTDRNIEITLCSKFQSSMNKDTAQEAVGDALEEGMETILQDLQSGRAGLRSVITSLIFSANDEVVYDEVENLAILRFTVVVRYKSFLNCV